jgi:hypothetical protein
MSRKLRDSIKKIIAHKQKYTCAICLELLPPSFQVDHIIPHSISNDDSEENLQALCPNCHSLKTQRENLRIYQYKKLREECPTDYILCWFCIETYQNTKEQEHKMICSRQLKNIEQSLKKQKEIISSFEEVLNKYKYVSCNKIKDLSCKIETIDINKINNVNINEKKVIENDGSDETLKIKVVFNNDSSYVYVKDNFVCKIKSNDIFPDDIAECVFMATRTKKDSNKYSCVDISVETNINENERVERSEEVCREDCVDFLIDSLQDLLPERIFKKGEDIKWMSFL